MTIKILSVDDELDMEQLIRQRFRRQIRSGDVEFMFAHNGLEALSVLAENSDIGLILSDINMPEMDGLTLLAKVNELKNPIIKTVIVSAYGDMENIRTAMNRGAFDFVTKPINFDDLEITIEKTIKEVDAIKNAMKDRDKLVSIERDLNTAREIQLSILPKDFPAFPERNDFDIYASMLPAKSVGGDFYDFFLIDDEHIGCVIADVSGKGVPSAIFMAVSRTILRATALKDMPPDECLEYTNNLLCKESINSMFVTVFYGILNTTTGELRYANGGHNPPYRISANGDVDAIPKTGDMVLGILDGLDYKLAQLTINPGDSLFLFTDGVSEAENELKKLFTEARLEMILQENCSLSPKEICDKVLSEIHNFANTAEQSDDITMLSLKYNGK